MSRYLITCVNSIIKLEEVTEIKFSTQTGFVSVVINGAERDIAKYPVETEEDRTFINRAAYSYTMWLTTEKLFFDFHYPTRITDSTVGQHTEMIKARQNSISMRNGAYTSPEERSRNNIERMNSEDEAYIRQASQIVESTNRIANGFLDDGFGFSNTF
jgi:hypothetical protein